MRQCELYPLVYMAEGRFKDLGGNRIKIKQQLSSFIRVQGQPLGIDIMYLVLGNRNMQVRFGLKVVWES